MSPEDRNAHVSAIERAAKYAETSGDKLVAHRARMGSAALAFDVVSADQWRKDAEQVHAQALEREAALLVKLEEANAACLSLGQKLIAANAIAASACASAIRMGTPRSIGSQAAHLVGAIIARVRR